MWINVLYKNIQKRIKVHSTNFEEINYLERQFKL